MRAEFKLKVWPRRHYCFGTMPAADVSHSSFFVLSSKIQSKPFTLVLTHSMKTLR